MIKNIINSKWILIVAIAIVTVIGGVSLVQAWTDTSLSPVNGGVVGPIVSGITPQTKAGNLTLGNDITIGLTSRILGSAYIAGGLKLNKNTSNCNLKVDGTGDVVCAGVSAGVTGPYDCNGGGGGSGGYCNLPGPAAQQCFLTKIHVDGSNIDSYDCEVYYDSGSSSWKIHWWGDDITFINCQAICIQ